MVDGKNYPWDWTRILMIQAGQTGVIEWCTRGVYNYSGKAVGILYQEISQ